MNQFTKSVVQYIPGLRSYTSPYITSTNSVDMSGIEDIASNTEKWGSESHKKIDGAFHSHLGERIRPYLDIIDHLRSIGIDQDLPLPAIAVIGDQSSGKSSVLEALSGVALPRGTGIVTRCPLMLMLRKMKGGLQWKAIMTCNGITEEFTDPTQVGEKISAAQKDLAGDGVGISNELIRLEIMSPDVCDLTLIDLPGIARVPVRGQPDNIGDQIKKLILSFIEKSETINLVVVPCNVDIATTEALKMAQEVDPDGKRTFAILTKPDLVDPGTEGSVLDIVYNNVIPLKKGYMVVKCRGQQQVKEKISLAMATKAESEFFQKHRHFSRLLDERKATISYLANTLTQELVGHIKNTLPTISDRIKEELEETKKDLRDCIGGPPTNHLERKAFLTDCIYQFSSKIDRLAAGEHVNKKNLFVTLRKHFQEFQDELEDSKKPYSEKIQQVVNDYEHEHRGKELLGFTDYKVFERIVQTLVINVKGSALNTLGVVNETIYEHFIEILESCFSNYPFLRCVAMNKIEQIKSKQEAEVEKRIHEQFYMEQLVYAQDKTYIKALKTLKPESVEGSENVTSPHNLYDHIVKYSKMLEAYYEIVIQRLADQIPMLLEYFLLKDSARLLCSEMLALMDGVDIDKALCEGSDIGQQRNALRSRIDRLNQAQEKLSQELK